MKTIFDFHAHPTFKSFLTSPDPKKRADPWEIFRGKALQLVAPFLRSQASFDQSIRGNVRLQVMPIVPLETGFSELVLIEAVATKFLAISNEFIRWINAEEFSYHDLFWMEYEHLCNNLKNKGRRINVVRYAEDVIHDKNVLNLILSVEGSHALQEGKRTHQVRQPATYLGNLRKLKNESRFSVLYVTLTHLTWNNICNHCYGTRISDNRIFKPNPHVRGISAVGFQLIDLAYDVTQGKRVLIDIKHMSLFARLELYRYRRKKAYQNIPLIASHVGVTGFSAEDLLAHIHPSTHYAGPNKEYIVVDYKDVPGIGKGKKNETDFNPWSINLYDEDIREVIDSGGLIGLSLDQRILGFGRNKEEFFLYTEFNELLASDFPEPIKRRETELDDQDELVTPYLEQEDLPSAKLSAQRRKHVRYLVNNLLHIIRIGGPTAWKQVCIGSDFDGLINPINSCTNSLGLPDLEEDLARMTDDMIREDLKVNPHHQYYVKNLREHIRDVMFDNGERFLKTYFSESYLHTGNKPKA